VYEVSSNGIIWTNEKRRLGDLIPWPINPRQIKKDQAQRLSQSLDEFSQVETIAIGPDNEIYNGHQRLNVWIDEHGPDYEVDCRVASRELTEDERKKLTVFLHKGAAGEWDFDLLANNFEVDDLLNWGFEPQELDLTLWDSEEPPEDPGAQTLAERFIVLPFSVLDARQGYWQERKNAWLSLGIQSELGRGEGCKPPHPPTVTQNADGSLNYGGTKGTAKRFDRQRQSAVVYNSGGPGELSCDYKNRDFMRTGSQLKGNLWHGGTAESTPKVAEVTQTGTSIFDPVLCELAYRWFCPSNNAMILDPFSGGSVRGIVAEYLGYKYTGIELRPEQVVANKKQAENLDLSPTWIVGDSINVIDLASGEYDFVFSCPPYYNLEIYSDLPGELSALSSYEEFISQYRSIVASSISMLKDNRFACFVVGDLRDKQGFYRNFVSDTIDAFQRAGMELYNEAILVTAVGSLTIRVGKQFQGYRKLGKTHQNVLIFYKGDPKAIKQYGDVECGDIEIKDK